ncbi:MAG: hypothetical protein COB09_18955 [Thalassobium sp.]|nr:MAG: hypothetical protein COB09_18955 [Thalassobium sp.]
MTKKLILENTSFLKECGQGFEFPVDENNILTINKCATIGIGDYNRGHFDLWSFDMTNEGDRINIGIAQIKIDMSTLKTNIDIHGELIKNLERELKDEMADHEVKINHLKSQISKLMAIEYQGDEG